MAVGGYGRGELSPHSDIDLLFLLAPKTDVSAAILRGLLYPLWDAGFQVGHATRSAKDTIERAASDLDTATTILSARLIAGDEAPFEELVDRRARWLAKDKRPLTRRILDAVSDRHRRVERAGWSLAPDLKEDRGGLRDVHAVGWLRTIAGEPAVPALDEPAEILLAVREALHAEVARKSDRLRIDLQDAVARRCGFEGEDAADMLMTAVHSAARTIEHRGGLARDALTARLLGGPKRSGSTQLLDHGIRIDDGTLMFGDELLDVTPEAALRLLAAHSDTGRPLSRASVERLERAFARGTVDGWSPAMRDAFVAIMRGRSSAHALEALDHAGGWDALLPEWRSIRGRAQHDPYHRYTVDGHSFVTVSEIPRVVEADPVARAALEEADRLDLLLLGALLHDVGKGSGEDHSVAGERIARAALTRMGLADNEIEHVAALVRWHLLLVDTATRRDLDDGSVIEAVARTVGDPAQLRHLYVLSVADGRATGPEGWSAWKAALVLDLYRKVLIALETGEVPTRSDVAARAREVEAYEPALAGRAEETLSLLPPSYLEATTVPDMVDDVKLLLQRPRPGEVRFRIDHGAEPGQVAITLCVPDRPGTLARTAGVAALHRLSVLTARAYSTSNGLALERLIVRAPHDPNWERFEADLEAAYSGRLAVEARLERKAADYATGNLPSPHVTILEDESEHSTVVEVRATDTLGLLYAITAALNDLDLDIHVAKIDTLGERVVDVFYVRTAWGTKLEADQADEVTRAIEHRIRRLLA